MSGKQARECAAHSFPPLDDGTQAKYKIRVVKDDEEDEDEDEKKRPAANSAAAGAPGVLVGK